MATEALTVYGVEKELSELGRRVQTLMPSAQKLTPSEAMAVAQIALAHGLDPFNGEVWGIKAESGQWYGVMVGIKGLRKCATRQAKEENSHYWTEKRRVDPKQYNEPDSSVVYEVILRDFANIQAYAKSFSALRDAGIPYEIAKEMLGNTPQVVGVGIAKPDERSKMKIHARAEKRAEADAIKKRYGVSFGAGVISEGDKIDDETQSIVDAVDGEAVTLDSAEQSQREAAAPALPDIDEAFPPAQQKVGPLPRDGNNKVDTRKWEAWQIKFVRESGYAVNDFGAKGVLGLSCLKQDATESEIDAWCKLYRAIRPLVPTDETPSQADAAEQANRQYREGKTLKELGL